MAKQSKPMPEDTVNPYQSPLQTSAPHPGSSDDCVVRERRLVFISLLLAVLITVLSIETDFLSLAWRHDYLFLIATTRVIFLGIILAPLSLYIVLNGWRGVVASRGRMIAIGVIVVGNLAMNVFFLVQ